MYAKKIFRFLQFRIQRFLLYINHMIYQINDFSTIIPTESFKNIDFIKSHCVKIENQTFHNK